MMEGINLDPARLPRKSSAWKILATSTEVFLNHKCNAMKAVPTYMYTQNNVLTLNPENVIDLLIDVNVSVTFGWFSGKLASLIYSATISSMVTAILQVINTIIISYFGAKFMNCPACIINCF